MTPLGPKDLYIENSMSALVVSLLWFSRDLRRPDPLVLSLMIANWLLDPHAHFEPTFSTPNTFQVPVLTDIYVKTRVNRRI